MTLRNWLGFSELMLLYLKNGKDNSTYFIRLLWCSNEIMNPKLLAYCRGSINTYEQNLTHSLILVSLWMCFCIDIPVFKRRLLSYLFSPAPDAKDYRFVSPPQLLCWQWSPHNGTITLIRHPRPQTLLLSTKGGHRQTAICKLVKGPSLGTQSVSTLILDFPASRTIRKKNCCLSHLVHGNLYRRPS